jgi:hypothetical protein
MMGFILAELGEWRDKRMRKTVAASALLLGLLAFLGPLQPMLLSLAATGIFIIAGWAEGSHFQAPSGSHQRVIDFPIAAGKVAAAQVLASAALWLLILFSLSPLLAASAIAWGLSARTIAACLSCWLLSFLVAAAAGFFSSFTLYRSEGVVGLLLIFAWIVASFVFAWLRPSNPFIQAWRILKLEDGIGVYVGMGAEAAAALILFAATAPSIAMSRRMRDA